MLQRVIPEWRETTASNFVDPGIIEPWKYHMNNVVFKTSAFPFGQVIHLDNLCLVQDRDPYARDAVVDELVIAISSIHAVVAGEIHVLNFHDADGKQVPSDSAYDMPRKYVFTKSMMLNTHPSKGRDNLHPTKVDFTITVQYNPDINNNNRIRIELEGKETFNEETTAFRSVSPIGVELAIFIHTKELDLLDIIGAKPRQSLYKVENPFVGRSDYGNYKAMIVSAESAVAARKNYHPDMLTVSKDRFVWDKETWPGRHDQLLVTPLGASAHRISNTVIMTDKVGGVPDNEDVWSK